MTRDEVIEELNHILESGEVVATSHIREAIRLLEQDKEAKPRKRSIDMLPCSQWHNR